MEPVCAEVFPGNSIDASSYPAFIRDNDIWRGIIIADKGFPPGKIIEEVRERSDLHFLTPIKRNDSHISSNDMLSFEGVLSGIDAHVVYNNNIRRSRSRAAGIYMLLRMQRRLLLKKHHTLHMRRKRHLFTREVCKKAVCFRRDCS